MAIGEPSDWTSAREQRLRAQFPQLQVGSPSDVLHVDAYTVANGGAPTEFSQTVMRLAKHAATQLKSSPQAVQPDLTPSDPSAPPTPQMLK